MGLVILTVTLNAALDVTYEVDELRPGTSHRVQSVHARAGGKGVNVARVLAALGEDVLVTGFLGGATGALIRADLDQAGIRETMVGVAGESRRTVTIVSCSDGEATAVNEAGPTINPGEWTRFLDRFSESTARVAVVVLSGSLPGGVPVEAYAQLVRLVAATGGRTIVDAGGAVLRQAVAARPDVVKPNADELAEATGISAPLEAAAALRAAGARTVVASLGHEGMFALTPNGGWSARVPERLRGNQTGAGDAAVAAIAMGLAADSSWPDILADAVACSAAAVVASYAGDVDEETRRRLRPIIRVEEIDATRFGG